MKVGFKVTFGVILPYVFLVKIRFLLIIFTSLIFRRGEGFQDQGPCCDPSLDPCMIYIVQTILPAEVFI